MKQPDLPSTEQITGDKEELSHLEALLLEGVDSLHLQIEQILNICKQNDITSEQSIHVMITHSETARISTMMSLVDELSENHLESLHDAIVQLPDKNKRFEFQAELLTYFSPQRRRERAYLLWNEFERVSDAYTKAKLLFGIARISSDELTSEVVTSSNTLKSIVKLARNMESIEARMRSLAAIASQGTGSFARQLYKIILKELRESPNDTLIHTTLGTLSVKPPVEFQLQMISCAKLIKSVPVRADTLIKFVQVRTEDTELKLEILSLIKQIESETDKAESLINLAPNLYSAIPNQQYSEVLEKALDIAIHLSTNTLRARALVALAPHVTNDILGETLAVLHGIYDERERASLLSQLAPHLPEDMVVASLAVAHTIREQDARVQALNTLALYMPPKARDQTLRDALAAATNLTNHLERINALMALVDVLPPQFHDQAFTTALEATRLIENENARARALSQLGHHLPDDLLDRALESAYGLSNSQQRLNALASMAPRLEMQKKQEVLRRMLADAYKMPFEYKRARAIVGIASLFPANMMSDAFKVANTIQEPYDRITAYIALAQNLAPDKRPLAINQIWKLIKRIEDGYDRSSALTAVYPFLSIQQKNDVESIIMETINEIADEYDQASSINLLAPLLYNDQVDDEFTKIPDQYILLSSAFDASLKVTDQQRRLQLLGEGVDLWLELEDTRGYMLWREVAKQLVVHSYVDALLNIGALMPLLRAIASADVCSHIFDVLQRTASIDNLDEK